MPSAFPTMLQGHHRKLGRGYCEPVGCLPLTPQSTLGRTDAGTVPEVAATYQHGGDRPSIHLVRHGDTAADGRPTGYGRVTEVSDLGTQCRSGTAGVT